MNFYASLIKEDSHETNLELRVEAEIKYNEINM